MKTQDLFFKTSSRKLNENLQKKFGTKINLESFSLTELEDARNKLRTQIHQWRSRSEFNENVENDTYHQAQWMLDAINAEILERDQSVENTEVDESGLQYYTGKKKYGKDGMAALAKAGRDGASEEELGRIKDKFKKEDIRIGEGKPAVNFTIADLKDLENIDDVNVVKDKAIELISTPSRRPMKPEKVEWFKNAIMNKTNKMAVIKLMYDLMLSGEGQGVIGSRNSMGANSYRKQFNSIENEDHGPEDPDASYNQGEYDREGDMSKDQLRTIDSAAEELYSIIDADENLPEWVQKKITLAMDYIDTARDYMKSNKYVEEKESTMGTTEQKLRESEVEQATAIVAAKDMVEKIGRYIEELSGMENETLIELGDKIRDEMGQEQARAFIESIAPAIAQALEILKDTREAVSSGVRSLATGETPMDMLGAEPAAGDMDMPGDELGAAGPDAMNAEPVAEPGEGGDNFGVAEPAAGGIEAPGRAQRESVEKKNSLLKILAG